MNPYKRRQYDRDPNPTKLNRCTVCDFNTHFKDTFQLHLIKSHGFKLAYLEEGEKSNTYNFGDKYQKKPRERNEAGEYECPNGCGEAFLRLRRLDFHLQRCGKGFVSCQLCSFQTDSMTKLQTHFIAEHNLLCEAVDEPDFEQVLNNTPYVLKRIKVYEELPGKEKSSSRKRQEQLFSCTKCDREFTKLRYVEQHRDRDEC